MCRKEYNKKANDKPLSFSILAIVLPASILYPIQSAGGIILTAIVSVIFYKVTAIFIVLSPFLNCLVIF
jgi:multidrug transporter EmrE-like cation transporter